MPSSFQGVGLIGIGALGTFLLLDAISKRQTGISGTEAITKNSYVASLYTQWYELLKSREEMLASGKAINYPDVQATDKLITRTKNDLQASSRLYLEGIESRLRSFDQTISELRTQAERYPPETSP